jgi:hypothetical protein
MKQVFLLLKLSISQVVDGDTKRMTLKALTAFEYLNKSSQLILPSMSYDKKMCGQIAAPILLLIPTMRGIIENTYDQQFLKGFPLIVKTKIAVCIHSTLKTGSDLPMARNYPHFIISYLMSLPVNRIIYGVITPYIISIINQPITSKAVKFLLENFNILTF